MRLVSILLGLCLLGFATAIYAGVPQQVSFQGILNDTSGAPVEDGVYAIKFAIYDDSAAGGSLWETAGFVPIQTHEGLFQHVLGSTNPIPDSIAKYDGLWVGITVNLEPEMMPRTRLTSVPFSFSAQYADTATVSLDKTIDAGELIAGALDTARFSAYDDLISENKVGPASGQVAVGDHVHMGYQGTMARYEDSLSVVGPIPLVKSISIPPDVLTLFFKVHFPVKMNQINSNGNSTLTVRANGQIIYELLVPLADQRLISTEIALNKLLNNQWLASSYFSATGYGFTGQLREVALEVSSGLLIEVSITADQGCNMTIGNLIVEYDVD